MLQDLLDVGQLMHSIGGLCRIVVDGALSPWLQGCVVQQRRAVNASAYMHSRLSVLKGWSTCSGKVVHAQDDGVYGVGRLSMVKVYSVVYYDYDKCNAM